MTTRAAAWLGRRLALVAVITVLALTMSALGRAFAEPSGQIGPLGALRAPAAGGVIGWIIAKQAMFYHELSGLIRAAKTDGSAYWGLMGISFAYGIFHAAGPGHGKAVISSYLVANEETWRRGVVLSFASALLQAFVAVLLVAVAALLIGTTAKMMGETVRVIEVLSYALIVLLGARLLWVKARGFVRALRTLRAQTGSHQADASAHPQPRDPASTSHCHHGLPPHPLVVQNTVHKHAHEHEHAHPHHHVEEESALPWGHGHGPEPDELAGPGGWRRGLSAIVAVGMRPCSGAIIVLVFALAQGLFAAGIASTFVMGLGTAVTVAAIATLAVGAKTLGKRFVAARTGYGSLFLRGVEAGAALLVLSFGALLLAGYVASERMGMF